MGTLAYNLGSVLNRKTTSICVAASIMVAVFMTAATSMLIRGIESLFVGHAGPSSVIVLPKGSDQEFGGMIPTEGRNALLSLPQIRKSPDGRPDASPEAVHLLNLQRSDGSGGTNVVMRGVSDAGFRLRPHLRMVSGRMPSPNTNEGIVGKKIVGRVVGLDIGKELTFSATKTLKVVGTFEDGGSATESEVFADQAFVQEVFGAAGIWSIIRVELSSPGEFEAFRAKAADKPMHLTAMRLPEFEAKQASTLKLLVSFLGGSLGTLLTLAAILGAFVGMHGSISARVREFGTMRALGFSSGAIMRGVMLEAVALAAAGALAGGVAALALVAVQFTMMGPNWASVVLRFEPTVIAFLVAGLNALFIGLVGAAIPALRALRITPTQALRGG